MDLVYQPEEISILRQNFEKIIQRLPFNLKFFFIGLNELLSGLLKLYFFFKHLLFF